MELKDVKELIRFFDRSGLAELEVENGDERIYLSKVAKFTQEPASTSSFRLEAQPSINTEKEGVKSSLKEGNYIESPMIGTFYAAASQGAAPFIKAGDIAEKGQTLCIIEAMKIMNTIEAEYRCRIKDILVANGEPVEYGQPIFVVEAV
ncbi:MAG: acetyl-CoA carboxylase biotin carboxyl carrier protein [Deferribacteraceae bacterium]|nr:acetyl-CoA carboxylase biotin carboxyl carrier protein [Deferribacteraceae bacterium]